MLVILFQFRRSSNQGPLKKVGIGGELAYERNLLFPIASRTMLQPPARLPGAPKGSSRKPDFAGAKKIWGLFPTHYPVIRAGSMEKAF